MQGNSIRINSYKPSDMSGRRLTFTRPGSYSGFKYLVVVDQTPVLSTEGTVQQGTRSQEVSGPS